MVKQRLRLASVAPRLLDVYAEDGMTLDQLMAFTVNGDHARQEQVFERLCQSYDKQPYAIRRMLTEGAVRASDKRAQFIGVDAYEEAGGTVLNDLFQGDDGGWLQDVGLVDLMVAEKLQARRVTIRAEGWKWIEVAPDFAYGHTYGLRQLRGETRPLTAEEEATSRRSSRRSTSIEAASAEAEELTDEQDQRMGELETAIEALERSARRVRRRRGRPRRRLRQHRRRRLAARRARLRPAGGRAAGRARAGAAIRDAEARRGASAKPARGRRRRSARPSPRRAGGGRGPAPISDRLLTELTAHRTLALRHALGEQARRRLPRGAARLCAGRVLHATARTPAWSST